MAASSFPQRQTSGSSPGSMTGGGMGSQLDGPPPSPAMPPSMPPAGAPAPMPSFGEMAQPLTPGSPDRSVPPEVAMGVVQSGATIAGMLDSMAGIFPDAAVEFSMAKDMLQRGLSKVVVKSGNVAPPSALGTNFPGGGFQSGVQ